MKHLAAAIALVLCSGCATKGTAPRSCDPVPEEFVLLGQPVYRDCAVDQKARPLPLPPLTFTPSGQQSCARAIVDVVVDSNGQPVPATARVVRSTDPTFAAAVLASLEEMRYRPAQRDGQPVAQLVRFERVYAIRFVVRSAGGTRATSRTPSRPSC